MMIETEECYETLWASIYDSIYTKCLKLNAPLQLLAVGGQHTLCVNNKGKIFTFGWNNYGQCGVPISSTVISKNDLNNNYLVEVTKKGVNRFKLNGKETEEKKIKLPPNGGVYQLDVTI